MQRCTVLANSFCLSSLKKKNAVANPRSKEGSSEYEVTWEESLRQQTRKGKKKVSSDISMSIDTPLLCLPISLINLPRDSMACWVPFVLRSGAQTRLAPGFLVNFSQLLLPSANAPSFDGVHILSTSLWATAECPPHGNTDENMLFSPLFLKTAQKRVLCFGRHPSKA